MVSGAAPVQRYLKELRGSSSNSARQRMKAHISKTRAEFERSKERWFLIAGLPIKMAGSSWIVPKKPNHGLWWHDNYTGYQHADVDFNMEEEDPSVVKRASKRATIADKYVSECQQH